jgi:hypothetical protein
MNAALPFYHSVDAGTHAPMIALFRSPLLKTADMPAIEASWQMPSTSIQRLIAPVGSLRNWSGRHRC